MPTGLGGEQLWFSASLNSGGSDLSGGGNDATLSSGVTTASPPTGSSDIAWLSTGSSQNINMSSAFSSLRAASVASGKVSLSFWMLPEATNNRRTFGSKQGSDVRLRAGRASNGTIYSEFNQSGATLISATNGTTTTAMTHFVMVWENNVRAAIYVNGVLQAEDLSVGTYAFGEAGGAFNYPDGSTDGGYIDDIRGYSRILTEEEITHLASSRGVQGSPFSGLGGEKLWLCPSLDNSASDISGNGNEVAYVGGMGTVADTSNGGSFAYEFDGVNDRIDCPSGTLGGSNLFSMSCWAYIESHDTSHGEGLMGQWKGNDSASRVGLIYVDPSTSYRGLVTTNTGSHKSSAAGTSPPIGSWHHLASVVNGSEVTLYVDGVSQGSTAYTGTTSLTPTNAFEIGRYAGFGMGDNAFCLDGKMDDIRVFHRILGPSEIAHLASSRGVQGSPYTTTFTGLGDELLWYCPSLYDSADDISGNGNHGTVLNGMTTTADVDATYGGTRAYDFDVSNKGISVAQDILLGETAYTYSVWYKPTTNNTGGADRIILGAYSGGNSLSNIFFVQNDANLKMYAIADSGTTYIKFFTQAAVAGDWVHLCITVKDAAAGYYAGYLNGIPFEFYQYLGAIKDTGRTGIPFYVGGGSTGSYAGAGSLIDDFRLYKRTLSDSEVEHLSLQRGNLGRPTFNRVNIRKTLGYVTDDNKFSPSIATSGNGQPPFTWEYDSSQSFGWIGQSAGNFRDRTTSLVPNLAGIGYTGTNGVQYRIDLPAGPGTYRIGCACFDALASQATGWDVHDGGTSGTLITSISGSTSPSNYRDINSASKAASGFNFATEDYIEHTFTGDHVTWTRNTSVQSGTGVLSSAWVELVEDTPPPATGFYNPFISKTFNPNYTRRIG